MGKALEVTLKPSETQCNHEWIFEWDKIVEKDVNDCYGIHSGGNENEIGIPVKCEYCGISAMEWYHLYEIEINRLYEIR